MAQNVGTLISAAIRPNDSLDLIASAFASEIKGGLHTASDVSTRNSIIFERREWGMMCYVTALDQTYQLKYNYSSINIMDNNNWVVFSGSGGGSGGTEWIDSVISIQNSEPISPSNGDRYIVGPTPTGSITWTSLSPNLVVQWNSTLSQWDTTTPTNEMSVRVDNEDNAIYNYEGTFPSGQWYKEKLGQVRDISPTTVNGFDYVATSNPPINSYTNDTIFLAKFSTTNISGTVSLNVNSLGSVQIKKPSPSGLSNLVPNEIVPSIVYSITYDGTYFQIVRPYVNEDLFNVKFYIESTDYIVVPQYYQYWVYGDLEIVGELVNYGHVIVANGSIIMSGGTFSNYGQLALISLGVGSTSSYNDTDTIQFTTQNTILGPSVSAVVKQNSLTASNLNTSSYGGATAGYILSVDGSGYFQWLDGSGLGSIQGVTAGLGLTGGGNSGYVQLDLDIDTSNSGLTYSGNSLVVSIDNSSIGINPSGELYVTSGAATPVYQSLNSATTSGDNQPTGLTLSNNPSDFSRVQIFINGQLQILGDGVTTEDCYFYNGSPVNLINLSIGDELYWNGNISGFDLDNLDIITIVYES
jgi:hypothetical protein